MNKVGALIDSWLCIDFFGDARRAGVGHGSSLTTTIFAQAFLAFVFAALLYPETPPVPFAAANLCLSSLLVALGSLGDEARPGRRAADEVLLATAPLSKASAALARAGHAAFYLVLLTIGMALAPAILLAYLQQDVWQAFGYVAAACACSGLAAAALGVLLTAVAQRFGPSRTALLGGTLKALVLGGGLVLFALALPQLQRDTAALPIGPHGAALLPPYHAARWLAAPRAEAWRLTIFVGVGTTLAGLGWWLGRRHTPVQRVRRAGWLGQTVLAWLAGQGPRRGIAEFVAVTMWRSPGFRARVLPLLGIPVGMVFLTLRHDGGNERVLANVLLQLPAIYLPFLVAFLPRSDQPGTGWVFAQAPGLSIGLVQDACWRALVSHVLLPVHALGLLTAWLVGAPGIDAAAATVFACSVAVGAARANVRRLDSVPFTANREGDAPIDLGAAFGGALVYGGLGAAFELALTDWLRPLVALGAAGLAITALRHRNAPVPKPGSLASDEDPDAATRPTDIPAARTAARMDDDEPPLPPPPPPTLRRELRAIFVLYVALGALPALVGSLFAP